MRLTKKIIPLFFLATTICASGQHLKVVDQVIKPDASTEGLIPNWPEFDSDGKRNPQQALIVVKYDGFPEEEIIKTEIKPDLNNLNGKEQHKDSEGQPITFLYVPLDNENLTISSSYGPARVSLNKMMNRGIYEMTLLVDKRMNIDIEPLTDFESITVYLDKSIGKSTPARFNDVSLGKHNLMFEMPDGRHETREINVTVNTDRFNETTNPDLDLRQRLPVKIESSNPDVTVYVDDVEVSKRAPFTAMLPAGDHTFKVVGNHNDRQIDIKSEKIDKGVTVKLNPVERRKFQVTASYEGRSNVPIMLYAGKEEAYKISENHAKGEQRSFLFDLPIGSKYKFKATYQGNEGSRTIKVTPDIAYDQNIGIKKRTKFVWPWERDYQAPPVGLTAAYVQKQYRIKSGGSTIYKGTATIWDEEEGGNNQWLHGLRVGVHYQPTFGFGLGLYTGLFYEYFRSTTDKFDINKEEGLTSDFSKFQEHALSLPVEVFYNLPFASKIALAFHGGFEGNFTVARTYSGLVQIYDGIKYEDSYNALKDEDGFFPELPGMFTLYWQIGAQLRLGPIMLGAQLTRPVTKHKWELDGMEFTTTSIKNSFSLTYVF